MRCRCARDRLLRQAHRAPFHRRPLPRVGWTGIPRGAPDDGPGGARSTAWCTAWSPPEDADVRSTRCGRSTSSGGDTSRASSRHLDGSSPQPARACAEASSWCTSSSRPVSAGWRRGRRVSGAERRGAGELLPGGSAYRARVEWCRHGGAGMQRRGGGGCGMSRIRLSSWRRAVQAGVVDGRAQHLPARRRRRRPPGGGRGAGGLHRCSAAIPALRASSPCVRRAQPEPVPRSGGEHGGERS